MWRCRWCTAAGRAGRAKGNSEMVGSQIEAEYASCCRGLRARRSAIGPRDLVPDRQCGETVPFTHHCA